MMQQPKYYDPKLAENGEVYFVIGKVGPGWWPGVGEFANGEWTITWHDFSPVYAPHKSLLEIHGMKEPELFCIVHYEPGFSIKVEGALTS